MDHAIVFFSFAPAKLDQRELRRNERTALATVDGNGFESLRLLEASEAPVQIDLRPFTRRVVS